MSRRKGSATLRLLFADAGAFHHETIEVPAAALDRHERLIDLLREEPEVLRRSYVDLDRLCSAQVVDDD
jgi:hypothetical protein